MNGLAVPELGFSAQSFYLPNKLVSELENQESMSNITMWGILSKFQFKTPRRTVNYADAYASAVLDGTAGTWPKRLLPKFICKFVNAVLGCDIPEAVRS